MGHRLLQFGLGKQLHRFDGPFGVAVGPVGKRGSHVDRIADPRVGGPWPADLHDSVFDLETHPHHCPAWPTADHAGVGFFGRQDGVDVRAVLAVEGDIGLEAFHPHAAEVAEGHQDATEAM